MGTTWRGLAAGALAVAACSWPAAAAVTVVRAPAVVTYRTFDPDMPPADMPKLNPGESAVCASAFRASAELKYTSTARPPPRSAGGAGRHKVDLAVDDVRLELGLTVDVWLPAGASEKLKAHEDGHRRIAERVYDEVAERAARAAATALDGRRLNTDGPTAQAAADAAEAALSKAQGDAIQAYLDGTSRAGQKVQDAYDAATSHGRRAEVAEGDAIRKAWDDHAVDLGLRPAAPATGPAGTTTRPAAASRPATTRAAR
ncbi:MAG: hypothetical protein JWO31_1596 [Phycisphaerales bacterium]|nr:hypothetical protein [Phycisphaerales bacterium]